jgi:hypothetical protein
VDVVKSRVDLNRGRTNLDLQHQISSMMKKNVAIKEEMLVTGIASSMVEFFRDVYYGLGVWKILAGEELVHHIPLVLKVGLISLFSLSIVVSTHKTAQAIKEKTKKGTLLWGLIILALMGVMVGVSCLFAH